jgi:NDP-sugar pyrophosphorylase family protein
MLREALSELRQRLCDGSASSRDRSDLSDVVAGAVVVVPAGGFGYRMRDVSAEAGGVTQKALLPLPNGETLIGRLVREYAAAGFRRFVALVNHAGQEVETHLAGGAPWGVQIACTYDPHETGSGRTGAMLNAAAAGLLPANATLIVHNADCPVMRYPGSFPHDLLATHAAAVRTSGAVATLAVVEGTPYPFTGMSVQDGMVTEVAMYPFIPVPTHTGITVLSPEALAAMQADPPAGRDNFEKSFFPRWAGEGRLAALVIGPEQWLAVDDRMSYRQFCEAAKEES